MKLIGRIGDLHRDERDAKHRGRSGQRRHAETDRDVGRARPDLAERHEGQRLLGRQTIRGRKTQGGH